METGMQKEKVMDMLRWPATGKRVELIRLQVVRESREERYYSFKEQEEGGTQDL